MAESNSWCGSWVTAAWRPLSRTAARKPWREGSHLHSHSVQHLKCPVSAKIVRPVKGQGYVNHTEAKQQTQALPVVGAADEASKQPLCLRG